LRDTRFIKSSQVTIIIHFLINKNVSANGENVECNKYKSEMIFYIRGKLGEFYVSNEKDAEQLKA